MLRLRDIMTRDVITFSPEATIREAMETLSTNHLSGAPVISGERVAGVISMTDILGFIVSAPPHAPPDQPDSTSDEWDDPDTELDADEQAASAAFSDDMWDEWTQGSEARIDDASPEGDSLLDQRTVEEAMTGEVFSLPPEAPVRAAATMMQERGIHRVLVMEGCSLIGIVSALDVARAVSAKGIAGKTRIEPQITCDQPSPWITI